MNADTVINSPLYESFCALWPTVKDRKDSAIRSYMVSRLDAIKWAQSTIAPRYIEATAAALKLAEIEYNQITQESNAMTTTDPKPSQALIEVQALRDLVTRNQADVIATLKAFTETQLHLVEEVKRQANIINGLHAKIGALTIQPATAPAPAPDVYGNGFAVFMAELIVMTFNDAGEPRYKAKGGKYAKFGVNVWPEALPALGIDPATLRPGPNPFGKMVRAELGETTDKDTGEKTMSPRKVIGLAE